jgi:hypothetical protein
MQSKLRRQSRRLRFSGPCLGRLWFRRGLTGDSKVGSRQEVSPSPRRLGRTLSDWKRRVRIVVLARHSRWRDWRCGRACECHDARVRYEERG